MKRLLFCSLFLVLIAACSPSPPAIVTPIAATAVIETATPPPTIPASRTPAPTPTSLTLPTRPFAYDPLVAEMIAQVQSSVLYTFTASLSGERSALVGGAPYTITTRYIGSGQPIQKAAQYVYEHMQALGLGVSYQDWTADGYTSRNVIGVITGTHRPGEIVLLVAHLDDTAGVSGSADVNPAPGADDNASGVAGVLAAADILRHYQFERTLRFVVVTGEEVGWLGSRAYADQVKQAGENIAAVCNLDMIGYDSRGGPSLALFTRPPSTSAPDLAIAGVFTDVVSTYGLSLKPAILQAGYRTSDHVSFWNQGYAAITVIEDVLSDFNPYHHSQDDQLSHLNQAYWTDMVKAVVGTVAHLGEPLARAKGDPIESP